MKTSLKLILLQTLLVTVPANADHWVGMGLRTGQAELYSAKTKMESRDHQVSILVDHTGKFENDNTFVQLYNPSFNSESVRVVNKNVFFALPNRLTYDSLMEALLKIRAARTFGAKEIAIVVERQLSDVLIQGELGAECDLAQFFAV